ncbi:hypothetical protein KCU65_g4867, partial [Aureobasidium melanogenum]
MSFKARTSTAPKPRRVDINSSTNTASTRPRSDSSAYPHSDHLDHISETGNAVDSIDNAEDVTAASNLDPRLAQPRSVPQSRQVLGGITPHGATQDPQHARPHQGARAVQERGHAVDNNQNFIHDGGDATDDDALPMDGLGVLAPARRHPELHLQPTDGLFDMAYGQQIPVEQRRSLSPMTTAGHLAKHAIFVCPLPACHRFHKSDTILDVYNHLNDDEHGTELYMHEDMARCPANCGYSAISTHHLWMYHMPKRPSLYTNELDPAYLFDCTHCNVTALPLLAFVTHWDHTHAVAELHSSTIACEICNKGFGDSALPLAVHSDHFGTQPDCLASKHFRILD